MGTYSELIRLPTMKERFDYLKRQQSSSSWGGNRIHNQMLYHSHEWHLIRDKVIVRDGGNDLAMDGYPAGFRAIVHHIVPITMEMLLNNDPLITDLDNLILCGYDTHNAIHNGDMPSHFQIVERRPNDMCPWKI